MPNSDRIKLENINKTGFNRMTGQAEFKTTTEYVCSNCRHLVEQADVYCYRCGFTLQNSGLVEHWNRRKKLNDQQFSALVALPGNAAQAFLDTIPEPHPLKQKGIP